MAATIYSGANGFWMQCDAVVLNDDGVRDSESDAFVVTYDDEAYTETVSQCFNLLRVVSFGRYLRSDLTMVVMVDGDTIYIDVPFDRFRELYSQVMKWQLVELNNA